MRKNLDPNLKLEKQHAMPKNGSMERPHIVKEELDQEEKDLIPSIMQLINTQLVTENSWKNRNGDKENKQCTFQDLTHSINSANGKMSNRDPFIPDVPFHPGPVYKPPPEPIKQNVSYPQSSQGSTNIDNIKPNFDFEENSPFQEGIMSETFKRLDKSFFQQPKELSKLINKENLIPKYFAKTNRYRQNGRSYSKEGIERHSFTS